MWYCPICFSERMDYECPVCGFDVRTDFVGYRTIHPVMAADLQKREESNYKLFLDKKHTLEREVLELKREVMELEEKRDALAAEVDRLRVKEEKQSPAEKARDICRQITREREEKNRILNEKRADMKKAEAAYKKWKSDWMNHQSPKPKTVTYPNGIYTGGLKNGRADGYGIMKYNNGVVHEGQWNNNRAEGYGKETYVNGCFYEGGFLDSQRDGYGKESYKNGIIYEGEFSKGQRNGYGIYRFANGGIYEGETVKNQRTGRGREYYEDHSYYEGEFFNDRRQGYGIYHYYNGSVSEGYWENGKFMKQE